MGLFPLAFGGFQTSRFTIATFESEPLSYPAYALIVLSFTSMFLIRKSSALPMKSAENHSAVWASSVRAVYLGLGKVDGLPGRECSSCNLLHLDSGNVLDGEEQVVWKDVDNLPET
jgi:hypothetical protein